MQADAQHQAYYRATGYGLVTRGTVEDILCPTPEGDTELVSAVIDPIDLCSATVNEIAGVAQGGKDVPKEAAESEKSLIIEKETTAAESSPEPAASLSPAEIAANKQRGAVTMCACT